MNINVKLSHPKAVMPSRAKAGDAGYDLTAVKIERHHYQFAIIVHTGVRVALPPNVMGLILGRSSLAAAGVDVLGGVIDPGYRGEIKVVLVGLGTKAINPGDRVAQLVFVPILTPELVLVDSLDESERGDAGFGSSGK